jgi:presenilin-like A22 family membrane protease
LKSSEKGDRLRARYLLVAVYVLTVLIALAASPDYSKAGMQAFSDPEDVMNSFYYFAVILAFTAFILIMARFMQNLIQWLMYILIFISMYYVLYPFLSILSAVVSFLLIILLIKRANWLIIDITALLLAAGVTSIFGISLTPFPVIVLLIILAIYDFISVYKTGHMVDLADSITRMKLPLLFIIPFSRDFRLKNLEDAREKAVFMGVGDAVIPNILVVSVQVFTDSSYLFFIKLSALFTLIGGIIGLFLLIYTVETKEGAHPGLPFLNSGVIAGYLAYLFLYS